ncbi:YcxB family protein [Lachnoclostridium sp. Marseille-P6806]|uniref:YcxB family protein n=1 Tax=Lachnoclostridium sp. Marseille-P6806 TaxID=2364793 RepID=UPI001030B1B6|nr:YcxB family protein [Lachnoclostridium sp. Marseille-P6806]
MVCLAESLEKARKTYLVLSGLILLAGIVMLAVSGGPNPLDIFFILFGASYYFLMMARMRRRLRRVAHEAWESDRTLRDSVRRYFFYEDHVTAVSKHGELRLRYEDIYRVIATETNLYIMLGKAQGVNLVRAECSPELIAFVERLGEPRLWRAARCLW